VVKSDMQFLKGNIERALTFISCGHFISEYNWIHGRRIIDSFEIIIGIKGVAYIQQDGEAYDIKPGDILLLLPGHIHYGYFASEKGTEFYWFHFNFKGEYNLIEGKEALLEISPLSSDPYLSRLENSILIPIFYHTDNVERLIIEFKQLLHITHSKYYTVKASDYLLTVILIEVSQLYITKIIQDKTDIEVSKSKFINILEWIRINIDKNIDLDTISKKFDFNKDYLSRMFKRNLGISTLNYINGMKIKKAKELLLSSEAKVKEIAYSLGFNDEKYFMKLFKKYENLTPSQYRNAFYKTHLNNQ